MTATTVAHHPPTRFLGRIPAPRQTPDERQVLLEQMAAMPATDPRREALRHRVIEVYLPLARQLAARFAQRAETMDDLVQVATVGLIKSVDGFDPAYGHAFSSYAVPMIVGELKRYFRDRTWAMRVPRRLQELRLDIHKATAELSQTLGHSPTVAELAEHLGVDYEQVVEGLDADNAYSTLSLDHPTGGQEDNEDLSLGDTIGVEDTALEGLEYRESLRPLLEQLPEREKRILLLRFFGNLSQSEIGRQVGISQMHVSRLLSRTLRQLREQLVE